MRRSTSAAPYQGSTDPIVMRQSLARANLGLRMQSDAHTACGARRFSPVADVTLPPCLIPRLSVHEPGVHHAPQTTQHRDQHGRQGSLAVPAFVLNASCSRTCSQNEERDQFRTRRENGDRPKSLNLKCYWSGREDLNLRPLAPHAADKIDISL